MTGKRLFVIGYLSIDTVAQADGRLDRMAGGAGLYAALGAARAGAPVDLCASVGPDFPDSWLAALAQAGIGFGHLNYRDGASRRADIRHHADGRRESTHYADPEWWTASERHAPPIPDDLAGIGLVVACPMPTSRLAVLLDRARANAVPVLADISEAVAENEREAVLALLPRLDIFTPSREETRILLPGLGDDDAARALADLGPAIIQKRGADGMFVVEAGAAGERRLPALATEVIDPTGAGDASVGAMGAARLAGSDLFAAASSGLRIGALAVSGLGAGALCPPLAPVRLPNKAPASGPVTVTGVPPR